ncbi:MULTISPECIES: hypothetical protein [Alcaligenaceae]|uniref:hypothetical protein n=1 Tax=Alcaligenaceae TaxID=506 RepID=UPI0009B95B37|nr:MULTISPECIES: hypothetical protein [Alcaligenaceae]MCZ8436465.1 transcriptional regulator [Achromobacter ruhlandii]MDC6089223.1 transcriptional regulator [Achromobacter ruhlandii]MDC6154289.1 transcriptional regulator [Achromobacter ruhlandii]MDD7983263.1 transcriptional regulator [Achromobacter ruhlandii]QIM70700.1 transcriptional regulator [Bordetella trematum]
MIYPRSQNELLKMARGSRSQREFAAILGVDQSCFSRYESGKLGAPVTVINSCLEMVANLHVGHDGQTSPDLSKALQHARLTVMLLGG